MTLGLLMETARAHQQLVDESLTRLEAHTHGLDEVVRDQIRRTFVDECGALVEEARMAVHALQRLKRTASRQFTWWSVALTLLSGGAALLVLEQLVPSQGELTALRTQRQQLSAAVNQLAEDGGRVELRRCGRARRLCVRIDKQAPVYGEAADYFIVKGY